MDTQLRTTHLRIERKQFTFDLKENPQGTFLRITESGHDHRNTIIIPATGIKQFCDALNEVIRFNKTPVGSETALPLGQRKAETPTPDGTAGLTKAN